MSVSRDFAERQHPHAKIDKAVEAMISNMDGAIGQLFDNMIGNLYFYCKAIVGDPSGYVGTFGEVEDVARLFLAKGLLLSDGTIVAYDATNPAIKEEHTKLTEEVRMIFYPQLIEIEEITEHFEKQKAAVLRFLQKVDAPFPQGRYFSEIIAEKYHENILPLMPMDAHGQPMQDRFAIAHRQAFDKLHKGLSDIFDGMSSHVPSDVVGDVVQEEKPEASPIRRQLAEDMFERAGALDEESFEELEETLRHPSEPTAALRRLMRTPPPWEPNFD